MSIFSKRRENKNNKSLNPRFNANRQFNSEMLGKHSIVISNKPRIIIPERCRYEHTIVMGASGKGKTVFLQNMYAQDILNGAGVIFVDPKDDQFNLMLQLATKANRISDKEALGRQGFHSFRLTSGQSETWNPLFGKNPVPIANRLHAALFADAEGVNDFYKDIASNMLRNLITLLMAYGKPINLRDVYQAVLYEDVLKQMVKDFASNDKYALEVKELQKDYIDGKAENAERLKIGLRAKLQPLIKSEWSDLINSYEPDIIIEDIINRGEILHFGVAADKLGKENYQPLMRLFLAEVKEAAGNRYRSENKKPCFFYCDEYGDVASGGFLDGIKKYRSAGIGFLLGFQDIGDLTRLGDHFMIQTITNCAAKFIFNLPEPQSADYIAKLFGTYEAPIIATQSFNSEGDLKGKAEKLDARAFKIDPDYLKNMDRGQCVGLMPYIYKDEYAIYKFKSNMIRREDYPEGDEEYYRAFWHNVPKDENMGLNVSRWKGSQNKSQTENKREVLKKTRRKEQAANPSASRFKRSTMKNFDIPDEVESPNLDELLSEKQ